jgi:DNA-binding transcriptional ArsR family regulator
MQEQINVGPTGSGPEEMLPGQSLAALLALVGAKRMDVEKLRARTRLAPPAFMILLNWLRQEYLVDVITSPEGERAFERVELTEKGESILVSLLEKTCELPEIR